MASAQTWRKFAIRAAITVALSLAAIIVVIAAYLSNRVSTKVSIPNADDMPANRAFDATPIPQLENHTCGLLSLSAAYRAYGLSPQAENLRARLGVDNEATPTDAESTGTLHPDLFRVLAQDGFEWQCLAPDDQAALLRHLDNGHVALVLVVRQTGGLHWVLTDAQSQGALRIVDSLKPEPTLTPAPEFLRTTLSVIAIQPARREPPTASAAHQAGIAEMLRVRERWAAMRP